MKRIKISIGRLVSWFKKFRIKIQRDITLAPGVIRVATNPEDILTGKKTSIFWFGNSDLLGINETGSEAIQEYDEVTEDQIREKLETLLNNGDARGVIRNTYLNSETKGYIIIDIEKPFNFLSIENLSQEEIEIFVKGLIKRIKVLREFVPKAKIGVWRYGTSHNSGLGNLETRINNFIFASKVVYDSNGQSNTLLPRTFYDSVDFLSPVFYHYYPEGHPAYERTINGDRTYQAKQIRRALRAEFGYSKPMIPIISHQTEGNTNKNPDQSSNQNADVQNATEICQLLKETRHISIWYALLSETQGNYYDNHIESLFNKIVEFSKGRVRRLYKGETP